MNIFFAQNYREFIQSEIEANRSLRGYKSRLAKAAGCHSSYLSQILKEQAELTLEQAINLSQFWKLDEAQAELFLSMVLRDRAGNQRLRAFYERQIQRAREAKDFAKSSTDSVLPAEVANTYYSSWHYAAVHTLALTNEHTTPEKIAARLRLSEATVAEALAALERFGILVKEGEGWRSSEGRHYLPKTSPFNAGNHVQWRQRAISNIYASDPASVHMMMLGTTGHAGLAKVKAKIADCVADIRGIIEESPKEEAIAICFDVFPV